MALWQCYGRYLKHFGDLDVEEITECEKFKKVFFPSGFDGTAAGFTVSGSPQGIGLGYDFLNKIFL